MQTSSSQQITTTIDKPVLTRYLPGDLAMWCFILAELTVFGIFFITFAVTHQLYPEMFQTGQSYLHPIAGAINTLALITSSFFVAVSLNAIKQKKNRHSALLIMAALLMATIYVVVKLWEYCQLFQLGFNLSTNTYFTLYFIITAFHFMHVLLGMIILSYMAIKAYKGVYKDDFISGFESGACYWHMVDLVWVILFPLLYVIH
jgi:nitric oxide reductase NorE protein